MTHGGGLDTTVEALASDVTAGALYRASDVTAPTPYRRGGAAEDDAGDEQMRTWLRLDHYVLILGNMKTSSSSWLALEIADDHR